MKPIKEYEKELLALNFAYIDPITKKIEWDDRYAESYKEQNLAIIIAEQQREINDLKLIVDALRTQK